MEVPTISSFIEAMAGIAMRSEDGDSMLEILQAYSRINDQPFRATNPEVGMEENNGFRVWLHDRYLNMSEIA